jgi:hypothetical protein
VDHELDLFEMLPDGSPLWREAVVGQEKALVRLRELSSGTTNEVRLMDLRTRAVIAALNTRESYSPAHPRI